MNTLTPVMLAFLLCIQAFAATSPILVRHKEIIAGIPQWSQRAVDGVPGSLLWDGEQFIATVVKANGRIHLMHIDTNGVPTGDNWIGIVGSSPRLATDGTNFLLAWFETNTASASLVCASLIGNVMGSPQLIAVDAEPETLSLRQAEGKFLAVWESSDAVILAQWLSADGMGFNSVLTVAPRASPQRHPSINLEGTNNLVCWMEQATPATDWRVVARFINESGAFGTTVTISQTNVLKPRATACSFGTNYLVVWSADDGPYSLCEFVYEGPPCPNGTNLWFAMLYGRIVQTTGVPTGNTLSVIRSSGAHTNPAVAFGDGTYLVVAATGYEHPEMQYPLGPNLFNSSGVYSLGADGVRIGYPLRSSYSIMRPPRMAHGDGRFCVLAPDSERFAIWMYGREDIEPPVIGIARDTNGFSLRGIRDDAQLEVSTNLVDWQPLPPYQSFEPNGDRTFIRTSIVRWQCIENRRAIHWAQKQWALDYRRQGTVTPQTSDLFGPGRYFPGPLTCPGLGTYFIGTVDAFPTCSIWHHIDW